MTKTTEAVWNEIHDVTGPLEKTLKALEENKATAKSPEKEKQIKDNLDAVGGLNDFGNKLVNQLTNTQSLSVGMRKGSGSSSNNESDRQK